MDGSEKQRVRDLLHSHSSDLRQKRRPSPPLVDVSDFRHCLVDSFLFFVLYVVVLLPGGK